MWWPIFGVVLSLVLLGCSGGDGNIRVASPHPQLAKGQAYLPGPLTSALLKAPFGCSDSSTCPESIGLIGHGNGLSGGFSSCTGFLVAEDIVATNSHCIPPDVKRDPELCTSQMAIKFLTADGRGEVFSCDQFLFASEIKENVAHGTPDYAFFKIRPAHGRKPYKLGRDGFQDGSQISIYSMQPTFGHFGGFLVRRTCTVKMINVVGLSTPLSPTLHAVGEQCTSQHGNSGSPVLAENGETVLGLLHAINIVTDETLSQISAAAVAPKRLLPLNYITNLACLRLPEPLASSLPIKEECAQAAAPQSLENFEKEHMQKEVSAELGRWFPSGPHPLRFRVRMHTVPNEKTGNTEYFVFVDPICLLPREHWIENHLWSWMRFGNSDKLRIQYTEPRYVYRPGITEDYSLVAHQLVHAEKHFKLELDLSERDMSLPIRGMQTFEYEGSTVRTAFETHWCSQQELEEQHLYDERTLRTK